MHVGQGWWSTLGSGYGCGGSTATTLWAHGAKPASNLAKGKALTSGLDSVRLQDVTSKTTNEMTALHIARPRSRQIEMWMPAVRISSNDKWEAHGVVDNPGIVDKIAPETHSNVLEKSTCGAKHEQMHHEPQETRLHLQAFRVIV